MALTSFTKEQVILMTRRRVGDDNSSTKDTFVADGLSAVFPVSNSPCVIDNYTVYLDGVALTDLTDYTMSDDGVITFIVGHVPSGGQIIEIIYDFTKLSDDEVWGYIMDGMPVVHSFYNFGTGITDTLDNFDSDPILLAGVCYSIEASVIILRNSFKPLTNIAGIMIKHGDETIDTKTSAITNKDTIKSLEDELQLIIHSFMMGNSLPYLRV